MNPKEKEQLGKYVEKAAEILGQSHVFLTVFTDHYKESADALLQFAIAVMLDKPIYLLVKEGTDIPAKVRCLADGLEFFRDQSDVYAATQRLLKTVQEAQ